MGTYTYLAGSGVNYNYILQEGYGDLSVMLDGNNISSSGTITMDRDRTLNIAAGRQFTLTVNRGSGVTGDPVSGTYVYIDGTIIDYNYSISNNFSNLTVTLDGNNVNASGQITMDQDHTLMSVSQNTNYDTEVLKIDWVRVPAGEFKMGDNFGIDLPEARPVHTVYLDTYYMSKYEVTFDQYDDFCDDTGRTKPSDEGWGRGNMPVVNASWNDAVAFCEWLSDKTGKTIKLPTEAQWEKAARGTDQRKFSWGNDDHLNPNRGNFSMNVGRTSIVGSYPLGVSPYGIHDMNGNLREYCSDWYDANYYSISPKNNPQGPSSGTQRVNRGACWSIGVNYTFDRGWTDLQDTRNDHGFRIIKTN